MINIEGEYCKDCKIFTDNIDENALRTIYSICNSNPFKDTKIRIMPDSHAGVGIVVGFTAPVENMVDPDHVGCDIGCCIDTYLLDKQVNPNEFVLIEHRIRKEIKFGKELQETRQFEVKDFIKFMKSEYTKARAQWPNMINDFDVSEEGLQKFTRRIRLDLGVFYKSIGTIGGGNHFIEIGKTPDNTYAFTIHTGSRNLGIKVWAYWSRIAKQGKVDTKELKENWKELRETVKDKTQLTRLCSEARENFKKNLKPLGYLEGESLKGYITDMVITQAYAKYNHIVIARKLEAIFKKINNASVTEVIRSIHNYIDMQDHIIRKGAIRSYQGEHLVIPFNMRDGLAICEGKSNQDWNNSAPHGSGRIMSRSEAKEKLDLDEFKNQMKDIYSTSVCKSTIDEAPDAYKNMNEIVSLIEPTAKILYFIKPVINLKSLEEEKED